MSFSLGTRMLTERRRTTFEAPPLKGDALQDVFIKYGQSARHCYKLAGDESVRLAWEESIPTLLLGIPSADTFMRNVLGGSVDPNSDSILKTSSQLITIRPDDHRQPLVSLVSKHIASHLYNIVLKQDNRMFWSYFNQFWKVPQSRSTAGWLWESHAIAQLSTGKKQRVELIRLPYTQPRTSDRAFVELPFPNYRTHGSEEQLATDLAGMAQSLSSGSSVLFVPGAKNQKTFDAFSIYPLEVVNIFQMTSSEDEHSAKASGLDFLWDALSRAKNLTDSAYRPYVEKLKPSKTRKWRLIFVIPKRVASDWTKLQSIDYRGIKPKRAWGDYVEQFVMVLDDEGRDGKMGFDIQMATLQGTGRVMKRQVKVIEEAMTGGHSGKEQRPQKRGKPSGNSA